MKLYTLQKILWITILSIYTLFAHAQNSTSNLQLRKSNSMKGQNRTINGIDQYKILVKFKKEAIIDFLNGQPLFNQNFIDSNTIRQNRNTFSSHYFKQVIEYKEEEKKNLRSQNIPKLEKGKFDIYAYRGMVYIQKVFSKEEALNVSNAYEALDYVEYAVIEPLDPIAPPATPDLSTNQYYKSGLVSNQSNVYGIDAEYAWSLGITGQGVKIADIEWGFDYQHEDLINPNFIEQVATTNHGSDDHGTAVAGIMYARNNGFGVTGMVYGADKFYGISEIPNGRVSGITTGLQLLSAGDVFVYEMQTYGANGTSYVPADYNQAVWDITKSATDAGIIVVAAAGNGSVNLDDVTYDSYRARGDNGAIIVGAGTKIGRNKASFSTYGTPVHVQGWGDWTVASTGYTSLYNGGTHANYCKDFSGTSSATPIVASAAVALQSYSKQHFGVTLTPTQMRTLLIQTGTAQGSGGHIGPLPNIKNAINYLNAGSLKPEAKITYPTNNQTIKLSPITAIKIKASVVDPNNNIQSVYFTINNQQIQANLVNGLYEADWTPNNYGTFSITVTANDQNSNTVNTNSTVIIDHAPYNDDLALNQFYKGSTSTCAADFYAMFEIENKGINPITDYSVEIYVNNTLVKTENRTINLVYGAKESFAIFNIPVDNTSTQNVKAKIIYGPDTDLMNNEIQISFSQTNGIPVQFYISTTSMNPNGTWNIKNSNGDIVASNGTYTSVGNNNIQNLCLANNDCYIFNTYLPFQNGSCTTPAWVSGTQYCAGQTVSYNGNTYLAAWCTSDNPTSGQYNGWTLQGACQNTISTDVIGLNDMTTIYKPTNLVEISVANYVNPYSKQFCLGTLTATNDKTIQDQIVLYPNPTDNLLHLESLNQESRNIFIYNGLGELVYNLNSKGNSTIDVSNWNTGLYIAQIQYDNGKLVTLKFIKN